MSTSSITLTRSFILCIIAYLSAIAASLLLGSLFEHESPLYIAAMTDFAATAIIFYFSFFFNNSSFYDAYWSAAPPVIALYFVSTSMTNSADRIRQVVVIILVCIWAARLTWNWASQWQGLGHEDWRYANIRKKSEITYWPISFLGLHLMPTVLVFIACIPLYPALSVGSNPFGMLDIVALIITVSAVAIEAAADLQLRRFQNNGKKPGDIMQEGLWKYSRHPNYFGEITFWWGIYLFGLASDQGWWWTIIGPILITGLFNFISVPLIEERMVARRPAFRQRMESVSTIIPLPQKGEAKS